VELSLDRVIALRDQLGGIELDEFESIPGQLNYYAERLGEVLKAEPGLSPKLFSAIDYVIDGLEEQTAAVTELTERLQRLTL
jgi:hypothetical protein